MSNKKNEFALGIFESLGVNSENNKEKSVEEFENSLPQDQEIKAKSTRGRKKKSAETSVKFTGKKVIISKLDKTSDKKNKTFYIDSKHIQTLESIAERTGMTTSELIEIAIQLLNNNLELEGFND